MHRHITSALFALALTFTAGAVTSGAQAITPPAPPQAPGAPLPPIEASDARTTRQDLLEILRQYPPAVGEVLRHDPSLLSSTDYLAPYPVLVRFVQQHPEIARNPEYFFDSLQTSQPRPVGVQTLEAVLGGIAVLAAFGTGLGVLAWLFRSVMQHRRWLKLSSVQAEVHTKLMDRLSTNEELLAYIQSPAGRRFLESSPIPTEADAPRHGAPVGPILWSMMAGIVLGTAGAGFRVAAQSVTSEAQQGFEIVGVIVLSLGIGFILASVMAYAVSQRLGLLPARPALDSNDSHA